MATSRSTDIGLTAEEKLSKCKIQLNKTHPFFSYLVEHLYAKEENNIPTMGVDPRGRMYFNRKFVESLPIEQLKGVLCHEVLHVAFYHPARGKGREIMINTMPPSALWNIAIDISANDILVRNGFSLPKEGIIPENGTVVFGDVTIDNIQDKSSEEIYEELKSKAKQSKNPQSGQGDGGGGGDGKDKQQGSGGKGKSGERELKNVPKGFDEHKWDKDGKGEGGGEGEDKDGKDGKDGKSNGMGLQGKDWKKIVASAYNHAKMIGKEPAGIQREFGDLYKPRVNWRAILRRAVASRIPHDFTYARPNRKFITQDVYLPSTTGEKIKILCSIDTSGSISQEELTLYMSELVGIYRSYVEVEFWVLTHDVEVHQAILVNTYSIKKLMALKPEGGGGTSHHLVYKYIDEKRLNRDTKLLISFTDGWSDYPDKRPSVNTIFVLAGNHKVPKEMPKWADQIICID